MTRVCSTWKATFVPSYSRMLYRTARVSRLRKILHAQIERNTMKYLQNRWQAISPIRSKSRRRKKSLELTPQPACRSRYAINEWALFLRDENGSLEHGISENGPARLLRYAQRVALHHCRPLYSRKEEIDSVVAAVLGCLCTRMWIFDAKARI